MNSPGTGGTPAKARERETMDAELHAVPAGRLVPHFVAGGEAGDHEKRPAVAEHGDIEIGSRRARRKRQRKGKENKQSEGSGAHPISIPLENPGFVRRMIRAAA